MPAPGSVFFMQQYGTPVSAKEAPVAVIAQETQTYASK